MQVTREALRREIGLEENVDFAVAEDRLQKVEFPMKDQGFFLNSAEKRNAQIKRMDAALEAQQNAYLSEKGKYYPKVLLVGGARYTAAPGCEDPDDSFLDDDDLGLSGGGTVAFQWNPNLFETNAEVMEEKMKYLQMKSRYREGTSGIKLQVKERYLSVLEKSERVEASWEARKSGRALLFLNLTNFKLGIGSGSDVFEALSLYARTASDYYKRVFDYNMAVAKLKEVCGILLEVPEEAPASAEETTEAAKESQPPVSNAESK
jgi:outer membrane protein TolC